MGTLTVEVEVDVETIVVNDTGGAVTVKSVTGPTTVVVAVDTV